MSKLDSCNRKCKNIEKTCKTAFESVCHDQISKLNDEIFKLKGDIVKLTKTCGKFEVGQSCNIDANCKNKNCGRESAKSGAPKICCNSGKSGKWAGFDYCYGMKNGTTCWSDAMCASGNCKGNLYGLRRGICKVKPQPFLK